MPGIVILSVKHLAATGGLIAVPGLVFAALTADAILPLFSLAGGAAVAVVYLYNAPRDADQKRQMEFVVGQLAYANRRITELETDVADECRAHRHTRVLLSRAYDALTRAGISIETPDPDDEPDHDPKPAKGPA